ncbi:spondin domain-containing protein [Thalassotalea agarivorans]|uniref:Spondin_N n=1 Tax=Thalassotalea agarivorans TaxID=349064 RepID=A0A1I0AI18_THASX|nr:spondin domain-containing protein [Thalassotalea agarivorans]SES93938.1 hypothetical protein SAMN05660429_00715 [Thalassotalea agarivorans]
MKKLIYSVVALTSITLLSGCPDDDDDDVVTPAPVVAPIVTSYEVSVTNLTNAQPLSPIALVLHSEGNLWQVGEPASEALELLAESGDNSEVLALSVAQVNASGSGVIMPGGNEVIMLSGEDVSAGYLSVATMLVNTNDAFTGLNAIDVSMLEVGESISMVAGSYDSGTEGNIETAASIPGPAGGGEGFNAERDDVDFVAMHQGVVSADDGLSTSALTEQHRFDNPTISVTITRTE